MIIKSREFVMNVFGVGHVELTHNKPLHGKGDKKY